MLERELRSQIDGVREVVMDFAHVGYITSGGLRVLLALEQQTFWAFPTTRAAYSGARAWRSTLDTADEDRIDEVEAKVKIVGFTRMMRREIRRGGLDNEDGRDMIEACRAGLAQLLPRVDTLVF
ncbi:MAG: hypothetical protein E7317_09665 [Clostridiales bacterium]|nr:hypothetical protein [Clostridiales bacterium]